MGRAGGKKPSTLGRSLAKPRKPIEQAQAHKHKHLYDDDLSGRSLQSITESTDLDEFLNNAILADTDFVAEKQNFLVLEKNSFILENLEPTNDQLIEQASNIQFLAVPRRPAWDSNTTPEELDANERAGFLEWRRNLAEVENNEKLVLTPFERNLEVWRQLWRVVERSDMIVQIVDARNPLLFYSTDLAKYVQEVNPVKQTMLLLNKSDLLSVSQRKCWKTYFDEKNVKFQFFSAKIEREAQEKEKAGVGVESREEEADCPPELHVINCGEFLEVLEQFCSASNKSSVVVGMVGYPNVGKSSTINVLCNAKRVAESSTPGKTKHFQTIHLNERICLCDCPGLVFPCFVATKSDMVCNGLLPIDQMRDHVGPVSLVCQRIPRHVLNATYGISLPEPEPHEAPDRPPTPYELLEVYGRARGFMASHGTADQPRSARYILKDFVNGKLLFCHPPPGVNFKEFNEHNYRNQPALIASSSDSIMDGIEAMQTGTTKQPLYKGKRKVKRRHHGEGQEQVVALTKSKKGTKPGYTGYAISGSGKLPTNIRL